MTSSSLASLVSEKDTSFKYVFTELYIARRVAEEDEVQPGGEAGQAKPGVPQEEDEAAAEGADQC